MENNEYMADLGDKRAARLRRSCELCRSSKGRCVPSENESGQCQRCARDNKQCVFLGAKPRPKRTKTSKTRVAEMEEKLDGLMALLTSNKSDNSQSSMLATVPASRPYPSPADSVLTPAIETTDSSNSTDLVADFFEPTTTSSGNDIDNESFSFNIFPLFPTLNNHRDVISKGVIDYLQAEHYVQNFKKKVRSFPFVVIHPCMSLDILRREKPFLLLTILTFETHHNSRIQEQLEIELKESLARRTVMLGEKSLDLVQGMLFYLATYHFYFDIEKQQIYQLCQMAISMLVELGLNRKPTETTLRHASLLSKAPLKFLARTPEEDLEAKRTYVGCYYYTSSICQMLRESSNLRYTDYLQECADTLAASAHFDTDYLMPSYVRLQHLADDVNNAFDYDFDHSMRSLDKVRVEYLVKGFQHRYNQMEMSLPVDVDLTWKLSFYRLRIYINEIGFHAAPPPSNQISGQHSSQTWYYSAERNNSLGNCLIATKNYLDLILTLEITQFFDVGFIEVMAIIYAVLILGAFATKCDDEIIDASHMRQSANFESYVNRLSEKVKVMIDTTTSVSSNDCLGHLYDLFQQSKGWYREFMDGSAVELPVYGRPEYAFMHILPTIVARCVDFSTPPMDGATGMEWSWSELMNGATLMPSFVPMDKAPTFT